MEGIKRFITCHVPVYACNFRCSYCYVGQHQEAYQGGIKDFIVSPKEIANFFSPERTGGLCYFNLCGLGETFLHPQLIDLVHELTKEGHFCDVITNGVLSNKIDELINSLSSEQRKHLLLKFSFHCFQLKEKKLLETFVSNVNKAKAAGISYTIEITPHDELIPYIDEIKEFSMENFGALPHITVARNENTNKIERLSKLNREEYKKTWSVFSSPLFDFKIDIFGKKRKEFCYAGQNSLSVNLATGLYSQCYCGKTLGSITESDKSINFEPIGHCELPHCFNGHAFLAFGDIPELKTPTYAQERNRITLNGESWLTNECKNFFSTKTYQNNELFSEKLQKKIIEKAIIEKYPKKITRKLHTLKRRVSLKKDEFIRCKKFKRYVEDFDSEKGKILILMVTTWGNIGDLLIGVAEKKLIHDYLPETKVDVLPTECLCEKTVKKLTFIQENYKLIAITGGGFLGSLWKENEDIAKSVYKIFSDKKIVIFPQTIFYKNNYVMPSVKQLYKNCKNLNVFVRDNSYKWSKDELLKNTTAQVFNVPDIVLSLNYSDLSLKRNGVLCCFRNDKEKTTSSRISAKVNRLCSELNISKIDYDTVFPYFIKLNDCKKFAEEKIQPFLHSRLVITDRLHGMIISVITGTPCIVLDNVSKKISGVYNLWLRNNENIYFAKNEDEITKELLAKMLNKKPYLYNPDSFKNYWQQIIDVLR